MMPYFGLLIKMFCIYFWFKLLGMIGRFWMSLHHQEQAALVNVFSWVIVGGLVIAYITVVKETDPELIRQWNQTLIERLGVPT